MKDPICTLTLTEKFVNTLLVALQMYTGQFSWAYQGAEFFSKECTDIIHRLRQMELHHICGWHPITPCRNEGKINIFSYDEITGIIKALEIYLGVYPDAYKGASLWEKEARILLCKFTRPFSPNFTTKLENDI